MMATTKELMEKVLKDISKAGDVEASAVVSRDGLLMAADFEHHSFSAETFAAMTATMLGAAETAISELKRGVPDRVIVESKEAKVIAAGAGPKALLVVMASPEAGLGLILVEMEKAREKIRALV
jgi:hypothetical protein